MAKRNIYKNIFARDFSLAIIQIWWRAEVFNPKIWTEEKQPYLPYIVFENTGLTINGYYDQRGIDWMNGLLADEIKNKKSLSFIENPFREKYEGLKSICEKQPVLSRKELTIFLKEVEDIWTWFEAMWWIWEFELYGKEESQRLQKLREESQHFVPGAEAVIRKSLKKLYPSLGDLISVVTIEEISGNDLPSTEILKERASGYLYTDNLLFVGKDKSFIEDKYQLKLEELKHDAKEFKGQVAFKGLARGTVKIVYGVKDIDKVGEGDVIAAPMTLPDILPAMRKSSAFVTDEGGIACHAAIMARELKKPCIIGTKIATKVLKDGDMVEVDANKGIVKIIK